MSVLERPVHHLPAVVPEVDERAARRSLREQIARLDHDLVTLATSAYPRLPLPEARPQRGGPRVLSLGELERARDELADRVRALRDTRTRLADEQAAARLTIERMLLDPGHHKWVRVTNHDIGEPGCKNWHVRPRLGLIGMLAGWWHVKVSSGCPLAGGPWRRSPRPRPA
jgi:hypothetical protein